HRQPSPASPFIAIIPFEKDMNYGLYQSLVRLGKNKEAETQLAKLKRCEADLDRLRAVIRADGQKAADPSLPCEVGPILWESWRAESTWQSGRTGHCLGGPEPLEQKASSYEAYFDLLRQPGLCLSLGLVAETCRRGT